LQVHWSTHFDSALDKLTFRPMLILDHISP
jgi:hypothetical protein